MADYRLLAKERNSLYQIGGRYRQLARPSGSKRTRSGGRGAMGSSWLRPGVWVASNYNYNATEKIPFEEAKSEYRTNVGSAGTFPLLRRCAADLHIGI